MFAAVLRYELDASVEITASHLPYEMNGLKFFTAEGGFAGSDIAAILDDASANPVTAADLPAPAIQTLDNMARYCDDLKARIRDGCGGGETPLAGLKIAVDAGNGCGGFYARDVLAPLGADVSGSVFLEPDGTFPNHIPNPENEAAMAAIRSAVLENKADLGIIFDTDVDRAGAVLSDGSELNRNRLIAMMAAILLREHPGTTIVTDSITSTGLAAFIEAHGGVHHRFKRGYRNVINESIRLNREGQDSQMAMETSGHGALKENYFLDDGAYLVTRLLMELARGRREGYTLHALIADLKEPAESREFRMDLKGPDFQAYGGDVIQQLTAYAAHRPGWTLAPNNHEGVRVNLDRDRGDGWFLLRMSLHDPLMPLNIESDSPGGVKVIARELMPFLARFDRLDTASLAAYCR
jgi:phosphomannomutase